MAEVTLVAEMAENFPPFPPFRHTAIVDWVVNSPECNLMVLLEASFTSML
jgi:hypothetical protein